MRVVGEMLETPRVCVPSRHSYFIQKGADVNAVGGELKGSPLHWATRYSVCRIVDLPLHMTFLSHAIFTFIVIL